MNNREPNEADKYAEMIFRMYKKELCGLYNQSQQSLNKNDADYADLYLPRFIKAIITQHNVPYEIKKTVADKIDSLLHDKRYNNKQGQRDDSTR